IGDEAPGAGGRGRGRGGAPAAAPEFRLSLQAGPKVIGVSFVQHTEARDESTLRPRMRSRGTQPAIASVTISGPYDVKAPGDSPSRKRIFVCSPSTRVARSGQAPSLDANDSNCAKKILSTLA